MAETTNIEWTDHTWSPWEGCQKVGPGCDHCYAEARNARFSKGANWGPGAPRRKTSDWRKPESWNRKAAAAGKRESVFPSLCDPFDPAVPKEWRAELWMLIHRTPNLDWLLLTKRIGNADRMAREVLALLAEFGITKIPAWPNNVRLGATVVNQAEADRDIPKLLAVPARMRFLSIEPMLGPINLTRIEDASPERGTGHTYSALTGLYNWDCAEVVAPRPFDSRLHWVICGGESGHHARPMHPEWTRSLRDQCAAAGVPFLFKQWGEFVGGYQAADLNDCYEKSSSGGWIDLDGSFTLGEASAPKSGSAAHVFKVGKKTAGRLLDGIEHNGFPESR